MATIIDMPKLSDTMTVGTLVRWLKNEGDALEAGDMLAEVETDKATMEVENFEKGILLKQYVAQGAAVPVGTAMCAIGQLGEVAPPLSSSTPLSNNTPDLEPVAAPQENIISLVGQAEGQEQGSLSNGRIKASPLAKKIASEEGISLELLRGTGPEGRIIKSDILNYKKPSTPSICPPPSFVSCENKSEQASKDIPISPMRSTIARRLLESKTQIPHFYLDIHIDAAPLSSFRSSLNKHLENIPNSPKITVNDIILKATAKSLEKVPGINASWLGTSITQHAHVHLAFGVALEDGLVTPVIQNAHTKSLTQISLEAKTLIAQAKSKKLSPSQMSGSTFTVTNLGMLGINTFFGIINPPNAGILSIGSSHQQAVVNKEGHIVVGERMHIGFSGDHRVVDGALAAQFLKTLKDYLEAPTLMLI